MNGKGKDITDADLIKAASVGGVGARKVKEMIEQVAEALNIVKALLKSEIDVLPCTGFHYNKITDASIHPPATPRLPQR